MNEKIANIVISVVPFIRISGGELFEKVCNDDNLTEKEVVRYMKQILQGVEHMHRNRIVHLDLKVRGIPKSHLKELH